MKKRTSLPFCSVGSDNNKVVCVLGGRGKGGRQGGEVRGEMSEGEGMCIHVFKAFH